MKRRFVLDENVTWGAQTLKNEHGEDSTDCARLVTELLERCHGVVFSLELFKRHSALADKLESAWQGPSIFRLARNAMAFPGKWDAVPTPSPIPGETELPADDVYLVRLAAATDAILVTTDRGLRDAIDRIKALHNIPVQAKGVRDALTLVMQS